MADSNNSDRTITNLSMPETMKIAALLADLMPAHLPPANLGPQTLELEPGPEMPVPPAPTLVVETPIDVRPEIVQAPPTVFVRSAPERRITAMVTPVIPKREPAPPPAAETPAPAMPDLPKNLGVNPAGAFLGGVNWKNQSDFAKPATKWEEPKPQSNATDTDWIPLGELSTTGYFTLINWRNDPDRTKHPRRHDLALDEASLALAKTIPFYVVGKPRVPDRTTVAAILAEVVWE